MPPIISLLFLAFAVSLDGFGVGVLYGLRKIRLPLYAIGIISACSGTVIYLSMMVGQWMLHYLSPTAAKSVGALILVGIGIWAIYQVMTQKDGEAEPGRNASAVNASVPDTETVPEQKIIHIEIKRLGLVIQILKQPSRADLDRSGNISAAEAGLLGIALSLDAFGAGIGAALIGFAPLLTAAVIAFASGSFIATGMTIGYRCSSMNWLKKLSILPGCMLILMGILKLM